MLRALVLLGTIVAGLVPVLGERAWADDPLPAICSDWKESAARTPDPNDLPGFRKGTLEFLKNWCYRDERLGWKRDLYIRDTGPCKEGEYYGTHPAVLIWYSPEVYAWLQGGRQGGLPDGAMIIKEMFTPSAGQYSTDPEKFLKIAPTHGWTTMAKNNAASYDGWLWGSYDYPADPSPQVKTLADTTNYSDTLFGRTCQNCHVLSVSESTFSALENITGPASEIITYADDGTCKSTTLKDTPAIGGDAPKLSPQHVGPRVAEPAPPSAPGPNTAFLAQFGLVDVPIEEMIQPIPGEFYDHVVAAAGGPQQFLTSDQCFICHDGQSWSLLHNMMKYEEGRSWKDTDKPYPANLGQWGEWRWSMMGLAGRDPIFYAQLESEVTIHDQATATTGLAVGDTIAPDGIENVCLGCHGVMGQRQFHIDNGGTSDFTVDKMFVHGTAATPENGYGALGRDGISCMVCHQMQPFTFADLPERQNGAFEVKGPDGNGVLDIYGPFADPSTLAMRQGFGLNPVASPDGFLQSSLMCGSCHTIYLPVLDDTGKVVKEGFEQTTFLEWANSGFGDTPCQSCHMPTHYKGDTDLQSRIANIQDQTFPETTHAAPVAQRTVEPRSNYARHTLFGSNLFGMEMFRQFGDLLGVRYMNVETGFANGLDNAIDNADAFSKQRTATVDLSNVHRVKVSEEFEYVTATVKVVNLTGHRFPTGVGFRRAFIEMVVSNADTGEILWSSGRTNDQGVIIGPDGNPLVTEFFDKASNPNQKYQKHHRLVDEQTDVQIYQELTQDLDGNFTTSFLSLAEHVKDNRILPKGWSSTWPAAYTPASADWEKLYLEATSPEGLARQDPQYQDGSGTDETLYTMRMPTGLASDAPLKVEARLFHQSIPPFYLRERFDTADGQQMQRLRYLTSHLETDGTPVENWKLLISGDETVIR